MTLNRDWKKERRKKILSNISFAFKSGIAIGFLLSLAFMGLVQQFYFHTDLFYGSGFLPDIRFVWMHLHWMIWIILIFVIPIAGLFLYKRLIRKFKRD